MQKSSLCARHVEAYVYHHHLPKAGLLVPRMAITSTRHPCPLGGRHQGTLKIKILEFIPRHLLKELGEIPQTQFPQLQTGNYNIP